MPVSKVSSSTNLFSKYDPLYFVSKRLWSTAIVNANIITFSGAKLIGELTIRNRAAIITNAF